ncbi:MAG: hypothetical protein RLY93_12325 [Sumerlaeia bacterium]
MTAKGYITDTTTSETLSFLYAPDPIGESHQPVYADATVIGRSDPVQQFTAGGANAVRFRLDFHWRTNDLAEVFRKCRWLKSLTYPDHDSRELRGAPPKVLLGLGELYRNAVWNVRRADAVFRDRFDPATHYPLMATVDMELVQVTARSLSFRDVRVGSVAGGASAAPSDGIPTLGSWVGGERVRLIPG